MGIDSRMSFLIGKHVILKVLEESDINESQWLGWFNDAERCTFNQHHYWPNNYEAQKQILQNAVSATKIQLGILDIQKDDSNICGVISLSNINLIHGSAEIGIMMDSETSKKPELFYESWKLILIHGFQELRLHKIYGGAMREEIYYSIERIFNFEKEGLLKEEVFKNGKYKDVIRFAVFADTVKYPEL
jgi:[ribosomal protein S5]-alanine N-acetyltransferase